MLSKVELRRFKCFSDKTIPVAPLTLLTGLNAAGKSTVLQSLIFLHQALLERGHEASDDHEVVPLNGSALHFGSVRDVVDKTVGGASFGISLHAEQVSVAWEFQGERDDLAVSVAELRAELTEPKSTIEAKHQLFPADLAKEQAGVSLLQTLSGLRYVPADRLGPAETYPLEHRKRHGSLGWRGGLALGGLHWQREDPVAKEIMHPDPQVAPRLDRQVEAWLADLFPGAFFELSRVKDANLVTLGIRTSNKTDLHRPQNVGFGVTYVLPVLIAILGAKPGDLVILENPEAHLHPRAQSRLGRLCAMAASAKIQVLVETHSEHVLNGARLAVHDDRLDPEKALALFFTRDVESGDCDFQRITVARSGKLSSWPSSFFDENERVLDRLLSPVSDTGDGR